MEFCEERRGSEEAIDGYNEVQMYINSVMQATPT